MEQARAGTSTTEGTCHEDIEVLVRDSLYRFHKPKEGQEPEMDIVFIHGLQVGDYKNAFKETWESTTTEGNKVWWPKEWLSQDFPEAQILSVSYDSGAHGSIGKGKQPVFLIVDEILKNLIDFAELGKGRPVVFVGHSLGGLVSKELCLRVHQQAMDEPYKSLVQRITGVFFYATPHGGNAYAELIVDKVRAFFKSSPSLQYLSPKNLQNVIKSSHDFFVACNKHNWETSGLAETQPLPILGRVVVSFESAYQNTHVETTSIHSANHINICKPKSKKDNTYLNLKIFLEKIKTKDAKDAMKLYPFKVIQAIRLNEGSDIGAALEYINTEVTSSKGTEAKKRAKELVERGVIQDLVKVMEVEDGMIEVYKDLVSEAGWALDNVLEQGDEKTFKSEAVKAGAVQALVAMLRHNTTAYSAVYCLQNLTDDCFLARKVLYEHHHTTQNSAKEALTRLWNAPPLVPDDRHGQDNIKTRAEAVLKTMGWKDG